MAARRVTAQRDASLRCLGWRQETILRMLENNLENDADRGIGLLRYDEAAAATVKRHGSGLPL